MKETDNFSLFSYFGISLVAFGWITFFLAIFGIFHNFILIPAALTLVTFFLYASFKNLKGYRPGRDLVVVAIISLIAVSVFSYYTSPTIFTGRDQGTLSSAAISLSQNHSLRSNFPSEQDFFQIYGPGPALNFPGFHYTSTGELVPQFPLGYISWLAAFYSFFGLGGLIVANALSFFLFLVSFYLTARNLLEEKLSILALFLVITSFVFSWFFKFTLSENLALALVWFGLAQFMLFWKKENFFGLFAFLLSFGLLLLIRIEAFAFLAASAGLLFFKYKSDLITIKKILLRREILAVLSLVLLAFSLSLFANSAFYRTFAKGFLNSFASFSGDPQDASPYPFAGIIYLAKVFSAYAILTYVILGLTSLFYFLKKRNFEKLIPYFILLPAFIYLLHPGISLDHPWMLRRFVFAIIPVSILYSVVFLKDFIKKNKFLYIFSFFLILTNMMIFIPLLRVKENPTLLSQIESISQNFTNNDLVLVDRYATGNPWAMMDGPLRLIFGKQAVYFFNPDDLEKIDISRYENVYFIVPNDNIDFYKKSGLLDRLITVKNYNIENLALKETDLSKKDRFLNPVLIPPYLKNYVYGKIYLLKKS